MGLRVEIYDEELSQEVLNSGASRFAKKDKQIALYLDGGLNSQADRLINNESYSIKIIQDEETLISSRARFISYNFQLSRSMINEEGLVITDNTILLEETHKKQA